MPIRTDSSWVGVVLAAPEPTPTLTEAVSLRIGLRLGQPTLFEGLRKRASTHFAFSTRIVHSFLAPILLSFRHFTKPVVPTYIFTIKSARQANPR